MIKSISDAIKTLVKHAAVIDKHEDGPELQVSDDDVVKKMITKDESEGIYSGLMDAVKPTVRNKHSNFFQYNFSRRQEFEDKANAIQAKRFAPSIDRPKIHFWKSKD